MEERTLGGLHPGERGTVKRVLTEEPRMRRRLIDMGVTPGTEILVKKIAPLGDPVEVHLRGYALSLRRSDAERILLMDDAEKAALARESRVAGVARTVDARDAAVHRRAAKLTEWVIGAASGCPAGGCASCAGCRTAAAYLKGRDVADNRPVRLALVGNPNSGKTTLFNALTGAKESVGNWPGVTVEKKERRLTAFGHEMTVVDLPGIYSLSTYSMEEIVSRNFVVDEKPDAIINILDATNLERNLYLTMQLMELERPMILALNMMDEIARAGVSIDVPKLSLSLGVPIVPISARTGDGVDELLKESAALLSLAHEELHAGFSLDPDDLYDDETYAAHQKIGEILGDAPERAGLPAHWAEVKLLENDALVLERLHLTPAEQEAVAAVRAGYGGLVDAESRMADCRYRYITGICASAVTRRAAGERTVSDRIDAVLTNKWLGIPIFLLLMGTIFLLTFDTLGGWLSDGVDALINGLFAPLIVSLLERAAAPAWLVGLLADGVIAGLSAVLAFLPQIALLFFFLSLLEDSGYMSRTAFLMDRALRRFGLSGKSFIPMLMGFGCTVPAVLAARTMENEQDRRMTIMLLPFISCSAKLPVYGLIASAFFPTARGLIVLGLYVLGILMGILTGVLFRKTVFQTANAPFVMELPPYRLPSMKNTLTHVAERVGHFLEKAGTILFAMSVVLWFLTRFTPGLAMTDRTEQSILGLVGAWIAPVFTPLGFGSWEASVAILTGFVAKEAVVTSLSLFAGGGADALTAMLSRLFTPAAALAFLVFVLLYVPCMAAMATIRRELHSAKYTALSIGWQLAAAYLAALLVYGVARLFG